MLPLLSSVLLLFLTLSQNVSGASNQIIQKRSSNQVYDQIFFSNVGFNGYYSPVTSLGDNDTCSCEIGDNVYFSGTNSPLNEPVSVHFRGPLILHKFAYYTSDNFIINEDNSSDWTRDAYFDAASSAAENVTFLTKAGDSSACLGKALTYADSDGISSATSNTLLGNGTLITSDQEYVIFSNISCSKSGFDNDCGVYRDGIPAYHGYYGTTKMFLFEFEMPTETQKNSSSFSYYDMPAIWLLNANIPRTSQYPGSVNCSCWASGCGEFDIFEVMNGTQKNNFYSTFHTYQGIEDLGTGIQSYGHIVRDDSNVMKGGVIFDSNGDTVVFMSNDTSFDTTVSSSNISSILKEEDEVLSATLATITNSYSTSSTKSSKSKNFGVSGFDKLNGVWYYAVTIFTALLNLLL